MRALILGGSAGVGRALSEALAQRGTPLLLAASDPRDLDALAKHLRLVYHVDVATVVVDAGRIEESVDALSSMAVRLDDVDSLYFPIGLSRDDDRVEHARASVAAALNVNLAIIVALTSAMLPRLKTLSMARIVGFGSIASSRGRSNNVVYSAAKRGLDSFFESLRHATADTPIRVQMYTLGYVATQQTFGKKLLFPVVTPQQVACHVLQSEGVDFGQHYYPWYWRIITAALKCIPWLLYRRIDF